MMMNDSIAVLGDHAKSTLHSIHGNQDESEAAIGIVSSQLDPADVYLGLTDLAKLGLIVALLTAIALLSPIAGCCFCCARCCCWPKRAKKSSRNCSIFLFLINLILLICLTVLLLLMFNAYSQAMQVIYSIPAILLEELVEIEQYLSDLRVELISYEERTSLLSGAVSLVSPMANQIVVTQKAVDQFVLGSLPTLIGSSNAAATVDSEAAALMEKFDDTAKLLGEEVNVRPVLEELQGYRLLLGWLRLQNVEVQIVARLHNLTLNGDALFFGTMQSKITEVNDLLRSGIDYLDLGLGIATNSTHKVTDTLELNRAQMLLGYKALMWLLPLIATIATLALGLSMGLSPVSSRMGGNWLLATANFCFFSISWLILLGLPFFLLSYLFEFYICTPFVSPTSNLNFSVGNITDTPIHFPSLMDACRRNDSIINAIGFDVDSMLQEEEDGDKLSDSVQTMIDTLTPLGFQLARVDGALQREPTQSAAFVSTLDAIASSTSERRAVADLRQVYVNWYDTLKLARNDSATAVRDHKAALDQLYSLKYQIIAENMMKDLASASDTDMLSELTTDITDNLGRCSALYDTFLRLSQAVCQDLVRPLNALWFALFLSALGCFVLIIFSIKLSIHLLAVPKVVPQEPSTWAERKAGNDVNG